MQASDQKQTEAERKRGDQERNEDGRDDGKLDRGRSRFAGAQ
jgi:hypothetical protein